MKTQGNERMTQTLNVVGAQEQPMTDVSRPFGPVVDQADGSLVEVTYASGRTVSLGDYEFVRIQIGARVRIADAGAVDAAFVGVQKFVDAVVSREESLVRKRPFEDVPLPALDGVRREIWVEYGMTLKGKARYESFKVDLGLSRPLGDDEDAEASMVALETYLSQRVSDERDRIKGQA